MSKRNLILVSLVAGALVLTVGAAVVVTWDMPPPTVQVEKVIPDERFPR